MKINVVNIIESDVYCKNEFGEFIVKWASDLPCINKFYYIELDIIDELKWGVNVLLSDSLNNKILNIHGFIQLHGLLEFVDDDYAVLRIDNYIIPFICHGNAFKNESYIYLNVKHLLAFPIEY